ncbi:MAG TPA: P-loop NTPase fold protein [Terracidiphilus sp.]
MPASPERFPNRKQSFKEPEFKVPDNADSGPASGFDGAPPPNPPDISPTPGWGVQGNPVSDTSTSRDKLGFQPYVDAVAAFLIHPDTRPPLTLSIEGEWGMGKSSFMRQLQAELDKPQDPQPKTNLGRALFASRRRLAPALHIRPRRQRLTFWFNAWRHDSRDAMWATFALSITRNLRDGQNIPERLLGDLQLAASRVESLTGWLHIFGTLVLFAMIAVGAAGWRPIRSIWHRRNARLSLTKS